jgi:uncharacterized ferredoxin-like protein
MAARIPAAIFFRCFFVFFAKIYTMAIINETQAIQDSLVEIAKKMLVAARTAPKARGLSTLSMAIITGNDVHELARVMNEIGEEEGNEIFTRDARNVLQSADVVVLMGTSIKAMSLKLCGLCGFPDCARKNEHPEIPCAFNTGDLGIAIGSAVSIAMDHRVDNRIMYTIGYAARKMGLLGEDVKVIYGIPMSATSKNPYFDRKK